MKTFRPNCAHGHIQAKLIQPKKKNILKEHSSQFSTNHLYFTLLLNIFKTCRSVLNCLVAFDSDLSKAVHHRKHLVCLFEVELAWYKAVATYLPEGQHTSLGSVFQNGPCDHSDLRCITIDGYGLLRYSRLLGKGKGIIVVTFKRKQCWDRTQTVLSRVKVTWQQEVFYITKL